MRLKCTPNLLGLWLVVVANASAGTSLAAEPCLDPASPPMPGQTRKQRLLEALSGSTPEVRVCAALAVITDYPSDLHRLLPLLKDEESIDLSTGDVGYSQSVAAIVVEDLCQRRQDKTIAAFLGRTLRADVLSETRRMTFECFYRADPQAARKMARVLLAGPARDDLATEAIAILLSHRYPVPGIDLPVGTPVGAADDLRLAARWSGSDSPAIRRQVALYIGHSELPDLEGAIDKLLADPEPSVRVDAVGSYMRRRVLSVEKIRRLLADRDKDVRNSVASSLTARVDAPPAILEDILALIARDTALVEQGVIGMYAIRDAGSPFPAAHRGFLRGVIATVPPTLAGVELRRLALWLLTSSKDPAQGAFFVSLLTQGGASDDKLAAINGVINLNHRDAIPRLTALLTDTDVNVRFAAAVGLARFGAAAEVSRVRAAAAKDPARRAAYKRVVDVLLGRAPFGQHLLEN